MQFKTIKEINDGLVSKKFSVEELINNTFALIKQNKALNCFITLNEETALERANELATLPHPHYEKTKQYSQKLVVERILEALNQHGTYIPQA